MIRLRAGQGDGREGTPGLSGLMDSLNMPNVHGIASTIDSVKAGLQAKVGIFLQNDQKLLQAGQEIEDMRFGSTPALRVVLDALSAQAALLKRRQESLMEGSTELISRLMDFKTRMQSTSPIKEVLAGTYSIAQLANSEAFSVILKAAKDGTALAAEATQAMGTLDALNKDVDRLVSQVNTTKESLKGTGSAPSVEDILVSIGEKAKGVSTDTLVIAGGVALALAALLIGFGRNR